MNMLFSGGWRSCMGGALALILAAPAFGALADLATAPLETSSATLVKPNIMFILDNSSSMSYAYLPDWANNYRANSYPYLYRNSHFNGIYYDPSVTYTSPVNYAGTSYTSMTSANTSAWTQVPTDGFKGSSAGITDLTGTSTPATYYTFIAGEYCSSANLRTCNKQSAATTAYAYPAYLRWCTTSALSTCQAVYVDSTSAPATYKYPRYPGMSSTATIVLAGSGSTSISGIKVNGVQILSATTSASTSSSTVAANIVTAINNCTSSKTGNCGIAGYSASRNGSTVTITSPNGADAYGYSPVVTQSGSMTATVTAFSGGTPGSWVQTTIGSSTSTYAYPGTSARSTTRTDCTTNSTTCTYAEEMTNFANWWAYYHTRMLAMKSATTLAFSGLTSSYRLGYMTINRVSLLTDFLNIADNTTTSGGQKSLWYDQLLAAQASGTTPLRTALSNAGRYYAAKISSINGVTTTDPMQYACQRNYTLLSTDGYWNESATPYKVDGTTAIGDQDGSEARPYLDGNAVSNTLADTAEYYYTTDLRSSVLNNATNSSGTDVSSNSYSNKRQNMVTSTIGLGASGYMLFDADYANATSGDYYDVANGTATSSTTQAAGICSWQSSGSCNWPTPANNTQTAIDDLWHAAVNGRGSYYSASNASDIKTALTNFLNTVDATTSSSAAVAQSAPVLTPTTAGYTFSTTYCSGKWFGELARYAVNSTTGITSTTADWAESGAGSDCSSTSGSLTTTALLDNVGYASRTIFTYDPSTATKLSFAWGSLTTTMQNYFKIASISSLSQLCSSGSSCLATASQVDSSTAGTTTGAGAMNLVNYLRGDRSNEGSPNTKYYRSRTHVLGDVVNSTPVYIQAPSRSYSDTGYASFKTANASRQGMVYVGANDGMLHAFNADTGAEAWAYIPSVLLPNLYKLADKNYASNHVYFVDGQITQADVYYNGAWHTIIVGGLGDGGRAYFALDVTDPGSPTVLWEFSSSSTLTPNLYDTDLGYTYGAPIITKLSDGTWAVVLSSGYNNVSTGDGKGHLWISNAMTGALIKKIDNGMGSNASGSTVTGCSVVPCPSGLTKISGWTNSSTDNTTTQVYGGDLYGNLWRFDISALTASSGSATVQLLATLSDNSGNRQPITTAPELGLVSSQHVVFVGTGAYLGVTDITTSQVQSMYAIKDTLSGSYSSTAIYSNPRSNACSTGTTTNCFVKLALTDTSGVRTVSSSVSYSTNFSSMYGWFVDMPESGERVDEDPVLTSGTLVYVSNTPSTSGACSTGGFSYINYVNYATGLTVSGIDNTGVLLSSAGLSSSATIAITSGGKTVATTKDSTGAVTATTIPVSSSSGTRRISWRRLTDGR